MAALSFLLDENIPRRTAAELKRLGHVVHEVSSSAGRGLDDAAVWRLARERRAIVVTTDKSFARRIGEPHEGVLVVRLRRPNGARIHQRVLRALQIVQAEDWRNTIAVMRDRAVQIRHSRPK